MVRFRCALAALVLGLVGMTAAPASAAHVALELRATPAPIITGQEVWIDIFATAVPDGEVFDLSLVQAVFTWDPTVLKLVDVIMDDGDDSIGDVDFLHFGWGGPLINENSPLPPSDGDGLFVAASSSFVTVAVDSSGEMVGTLVFEGLMEGVPTTISLLRSLGDGVTDVRAQPSPGFEESVGPQPGTDNVLSSVVVPEPGSVLLALGGLAALLRRRRLA